MRRACGEAGHSWWSRAVRSGQSVGMAILQRLHPVNLHERTTQWQQEGWTGAEARARTAATTATATPGTQGRPRTPQRGTEDTEVRIPVVEEDISISKREVERGHVRIYSRVTEHPVEEAVRLREERVTVERRPVDRPATDADFAAADGTAGHRDDRDRRRAGRQQTGAGG